MKRILSFFLSFALIVVLAVPVSADEGNLGGWTELLESTSVSATGQNLFSITGSEGKFSLAIQPERRVSKVDMLISYGNGALPTYVGVDYAGTLFPLTVVDLGNNVCRVYGNISYAFYGKLDFTVRKNGSGTAYYDLLSCKISTIRVIDTPAHGTLRKSYSDPNPLSLPNNFSVPAADTGHSAEYMLVPVCISDWQKFDYVTIYGSISNMALNSFRASIGTKGLPYEITYMESIPTGTDTYGSVDWRYHSYTETNYYTAPENPDEGSSEDGYGGGDTVNTSTVTYGGAVLFTVTIDLTGIDRTATGQLDCFFTCIRDPAIGYGFNVQNVSGTVVTADTTTVSWWNRFTTFMSDLFGGDTSEADQFANEMEQTNQALTDANEQIDSVTKPNVDEVPIDPSQFLDPQGMEVTGQIFSQLLGNELVMPMASITLICGLAAFIIF